MIVPCKNIQNCLKTLSNNVGEIAEIFKVCLQKKIIFSGAQNNSLDEVPSIQPLISKLVIPY